MKWDELSMREKAAFIKVGVANGLTDVASIRDSYNKYEDGGWFSRVKKNLLFGDDEDEKPSQRNYRTDRKAPNNTKTKVTSEKWENSMYNYYPKGRSAYDIPFIEDKAIRIGDYTTSTNALDSLAKYAGIHNRTLLTVDNKNRKARPISKEEAIGLAGKETNYGAQSYISEPNVLEYAEKYNKDSNYEKRAFYNANVFRAFQDIPAITLVNDYRYNQTDKSMPPLLHAYRYYSQGDYNRGNTSHTSLVKSRGKKDFQNPAVLRWWNETGRDYFEGKRK